MGAATLCLTPALTPASAQSAEEAQAAVTQIEAAATARPEDPNIRYYLAHYRLLAGDKAGAIATLKEVLRLGDGFLPTSDFFGPLKNDPAYTPVYQAFERKLPRVSRGAAWVRMLDPTIFPEGIAAYDGDYFISSMADGTIWRVSKNKDVRKAYKGDGTPRLGLVVDNKQDRLCSVVTNGFLAAAEKQRINRVECLALKDGKLVTSVDVKDAVQLNDLTIDPESGMIFATDSAGGSVWKIAPDRTATLFAENMGGANGIALDPAGAVYVAHNTGIARLDRTSGKVETPRLASASRETVAGIDGLYWYQGSLIGVQNVTNPGRVIRIYLGKDGAITRVDTLQSHHDIWMKEPTTAAISGANLMLLATTEVSRLQADGTVRDAASVSPAIIARIPLR